MANVPADPKTTLTPSLPEREEHREWIGGRAVTLLSHYWREDDPVQLTAAIGKDWADVLEGIPQEYIQAACIAYERDEPRRKPTPGAIYQRARKLMPPPVVVHRAPQETPEERERREQIAKEQNDPERAAKAQAILRKHGMARVIRRGED